MKKIFILTIGFSIFGLGESYAQNNELEEAICDYKSNGIRIDLSLIKNGLFGSWDFIQLYDKKFKSIYTMDWDEITITEHELVIKNDKGDEFYSKIKIDSIVVGDEIIDLEITCKVDYKEVWSIVYVNENYIILNCHTIRKNRLKYRGTMVLRKFE